MGLEWILVIGLRLVLPLTILRWPLFGALVAFTADTFDVVLLDFLGVQDFSPYSRFDKILDLYYLTLELIVSLKWANRYARKTSLFLYSYRLAGTIIFELTGLRWLLFVFPNLFESFFLFYLIYKKVVKTDRLTSWKWIFVVNLLLLIPKQIQEYFLHVQEFPIYVWINDNVFSLFR
jgi:hypothetical protein